MDKEKIISKSIKELKNTRFNNDNKNFEKEEKLLKEKEFKLNKFLIDIIKNN